MAKRFKRFRGNEKEDPAFIAIEQSNLKALQKIINSVGLNFSKSWLSGYALLCAAINDRQFEIASWLLAQNCKINHESGDDKTAIPLHLATLCGNSCLVEALLRKGACTTAKNMNGETALHISCQNENLTITHLLLNDITANVSDNYLTKPLHIAVEKGCLRTIKLLLRHQININSRTMKPGFEGFTALHMAIATANYEIVNILLENKADINIVIGISQADGIVDNDFNRPMNYQDYNSLHLAVEMKNSNIIKLLLYHHADVNAEVEHSGFTPLHIAVQNKDEENIKLLYQYDAKFVVKTKDGKNILHIALENDWGKFVEIFILKQADIDAQTNEGETLLFIAVEMGDELSVELLLEYNANVNIANYNNQTPLHVAAEFSEAIVKMLLAHGAKVDEIDADNQTPLSVAVKHCDINIIKEILHYKPSIHNISNKFALIYATKNISRNYLQILCILIDYGFVLEDKTFIDIDLLNYLITENELQVLDLLLTHGANDVAWIKNKKESSFIHRAARTGNIAMIRLLLNHGFDLNILNEHGKSALDEAIELDDSDVLQFLFENAVEINNFSHALSFSVKNGNIWLFEHLLKHRKDVCIYDEYKITPLHLATWNTDYEFIQLLLSEGACINTTDNCSHQVDTSNIEEDFDSYTIEFKKKILTSPLHIAVSKKQDNICTMFLECHANVNSKDGYGRTPLHIAAAMKSSDQKNIVKILLSYGADLNVLDSFKKLPLYYLYNHTCVCNIAFQNQYGLFSECECDLYDEDEVNNVITIFVKHIVLLASMKREISIGNYVIIENNDFSKKLQTACFNEISSMKEKKIHSHISCYDILIKSKNWLARYGCNQDLIEAFENNHASYIEEFPLYCDKIREQFDVAKKRRSLLDMAILSFSSLTGLALPDDILENIFDFLFLNDLRMLIATYDE